MEVLVDRELGTNYDRIEVGEMLQVALLCTQNLPAHRPKMSEVVRMLEGDGLAEKWAAAHGRDSLNISSFSHQPNSKSSLSRAGSMARDPHHHAPPTTTTMFGVGASFDDDDDEHSLDSFAMELSGPR